MRTVFENLRTGIDILYHKDVDGEVSFLTVEKLIANKDYKSKALKGFWDIPEALKKNSQDTLIIIDLDWSKYVDIIIDKYKTIISIDHHGTFGISHPNLINLHPKLLFNNINICTSGLLLRLFPDIAPTHCILGMIADRTEFEEIPFYLKEYCDIELENPLSSFFSSKFYFDVLKLFALPHLKRLEAFEYMFQNGLNDTVIRFESQSSYMCLFENSKKVLNDQKTIFFNSNVLLFKMKDKALFNLPHYLKALNNDLKLIVGWHNDFVTFQAFEALPNLSKLIKQLGGYSERNAGGIIPGYTSYNALIESIAKQYD